jgi:hypothetical protein
MSPFIFYVILSVIFFILLLVSVFFGEDFFDAIGRSWDKLLHKNRK